MILGADSDVRLVRDALDYLLDNERTALSDHETVGLDPHATIDEAAEYAERCAYLRRNIAELVVLRGVFPNGAVQVDITEHRDELLLWLASYISDFVQEWAGDYPSDRIFQDHLRDCNAVLVTLVLKGGQQ